MTGVKMLVLLFKRLFAVFWVILTAACAEQCIPCPVINQVALCADLTNPSCLRIPNGDVKEIFVGRCGQKITPDFLQPLARYEGKRCYASKYYTTLFYM
jgi:hypothetical protein